MIDEALRVAVYRVFAESGVAPSVHDLAGEVGVAVADVVAGLGRLAGARHLVLGRDGAIVMAHPFSSINLGFSVMGSSTLWWGGCAWDSFALPNLIPSEHSVLVATTCPGCGRALSWVVEDAGPPEGDEVAHFLIPMAHAWDDVVRTCANQRLFCSEACVDRWLSASGNERGHVMDLATLWHFSADWYTGRLEPGYVRREPSDAKAYFQSVGLQGTFWGLDPE